MKIGVQGYTIRKFCQDEKSLAESLKKVKDIGYTSIQVSGFSGVSPELIRSLCDENGLQIICTHTNADRILEDTDNVIKEHEILGTRHVGIGMMPVRYRWSLEGTKTFIKDFALAADKLAEKGMKLHYHNHGNEITKCGSLTMLEIMAELTDPEKWGFIFDTYWSQFGGMCPAQMMYKLQGRIDVCHFKDLLYTADENGDGSFYHHFAPVGSGSIAWDEVLEACKKTGIKYAEIEQDDSYGKDPFDELKLSYEFLKKMNCEF